MCQRLLSPIAGISIGVVRIFSRQRPIVDFSRVSQKHFSKREKG